LSLVRRIEGSTKAANRVIKIRPRFFSKGETGILADLKVKIFFAVIRERVSAKREAC
jgi:hypothetical protein